ncbi:MAG: 4-hydroxy-3-methylbut-2-enyl diphosphate reductase, partial [Bacillota bacterium]
MLETITAEEAGFCFGVQRAVDIAIEAVKDHENNDVYTLGPIIHNPQVVEKLDNLGVKAIDSINEIETGVIIIRSHGVEPEILKKAKEKGLHIIDATCPYVKNAQKYAAELIDEGYQTFIYGDKDHPEVKGIYGATDKKATIINSKDELLSKTFSEKIGFVAQTTKSPTSYKDLISEVIIKTNELKVFNTICNTTEVRQNSALDLAKKVDVMFVIGGHNSANTNRLAEICKKTKTPTYHIETSDEIDLDWIKEKEKIGI